MATIRKLRGRWQAQVRRRRLKPRCKSFDSKADAEKWARDLQAQVDRFGAAPDTRLLEVTTLGNLLERYQREVSPTKRGAVQEIQRIDVLRRHDRLGGSRGGPQSAQKDDGEQQAAKSLHQEASVRRALSPAARRTRRRRRVRAADAG